MSLWSLLCCSWNILGCVYCVPFFVFRGSSSLPSCLELKWRGRVSASRGGVHCPVKECRGLTGRPCFLVCSCGQGEEAVPRGPEQQPLGHRGRGRAGAGGAGDRHHPVLEALPHGQAGLSARHRGQRSAASEGKGRPPTPTFVWASCGPGWGELRFLVLKDRERSWSGNLALVVVSLYFHACLLRPRSSVVFNICPKKLCKGSAMLWALSSTVILFLRYSVTKSYPFCAWIPIYFNPGHIQRTRTKEAFLWSTALLGGSFIFCLPYCKLTYPPWSRALNHLCAFFILTLYMRVCVYVHNESLFDNLQKKFGVLVNQKEFCVVFLVNNTQNASAAVSRLGYFREEQNNLSTKFYIFFFHIPPTQPYSAVF